MAETTNAGRYGVLPAFIAGDDGRWSAPQTAMFVTVASGSLWALILYGVGWLIG